MSKRPVASSCVINSVVTGRWCAITSLTVVSMRAISSSEGACESAKIEFAFLPLDMGRYSPSASEKVDHGAVDDVFAGVHRRIPCCVH